MVSKLDGIKRLLDTFHALVPRDIDILGMMRSKSVLSIWLFSSLALYLQS
jgi:hypothetical protein